MGGGDGIQLGASSKFIQSAEEILDIIRKQAIELDVNEVWNLSEITSVSWMSGSVPFMWVRNDCKKSRDMHADRQR